MSDIFISYERESSSALANLVYKELVDHGFAVFLDTQNLNDVGQFPDQLKKEIKSAQVFICLLGEKTLQSKWVKQEIKVAVELAKPLIPIFQESFPTKGRYPKFVDALLHSNGVKIFEKQGAFFSAAMERIILLVKQVVTPKGDAVLAATPSPPLQHTPATSLERRSRVSLTLDLDKSKLDTSQLISLIAKLVEVGVEDIQLVNVSLGSVIITLEMPTSVSQSLTTLVKTQPDLFADFKVREIQRDRSIHIVTSAKSGVGKTLIAINLLFASAISSQNTLAIDLNFMNSDLYRLLSKTSHSGQVARSNADMYISDLNQTISIARPQLPYQLPQGTDNFWERIAGFTNFSHYQEYDFVVDTSLSPLHLLESVSEESYLKSLTKTNTIYIWIIWTRQSDYNYIQRSLDKFGNKLKFVHILSASTLLTPSIDLQNERNVSRVCNNSSEKIKEDLARWVG